MVNAPHSGLIGILTYGLARAASALPPLTLLSCDNLHANGDTLCNLVLAFALRLDVTLAAWIDKNCTFPNPWSIASCPARWTRTARASPPGWGSRTPGRWWANPI